MYQFKCIWIYSKIITQGYNHIYFTIHKLIINQFDNLNSFLFITKTYSQLTYSYSMNSPKYNTFKHAAKTHPNTTI